jgi:hypothetical protein
MGKLVRAKAYFIFTISEENVFNENATDLNV